ncbi:MAG: hypothetical protein IJT94_04210 [Oscillibacter sp.]|nr:hypothetical protein [Oscillibacter sp.]
MKETILQELFGDGRVMDSPNFDGQTCTGLVGGMKSAFKLLQTRAAGIVKPCGLT